MKKLLPVISTISIIILISCSPSVPNCGDGDVTKLVIEFADKGMVKQLGAETAKRFSYVVEAIRTTKTNEKTSLLECAAELKATGFDESKLFPIVYSVEMTDDGERLNVNVFGL